MKKFAIVHPGIHRAASNCHASVSRFAIESRLASGLARFGRSGAAAFRIYLSAQ